GYGAVEFAGARRYSGKELESSGTLQRVFLDRAHRRAPLGQSQCGGFLTQTHIDQREFTNQSGIFWLLFEEKFQFAARLSPSFLGDGMLTGYVLHPAQIEAQFAINVTQRWIRFGQYFC